MYSPNRNVRLHQLYFLPSPPFSPSSMVQTAGKRPASEGSSSRFGHHLQDPHQTAPTEKRHRPTTSFASVVIKAVEHNQREKFWSAMEPVLRKAVSEELEERLGLTAAGSHPLRRSPSLRVQAPEPLPVNIPLHLVFPKTLKLPIFTLNEIVSHDNSPVRVVLLDPRSDLNIDTVGPLSTFLRFPIKLEIMVLDGDFRPLRPDGDGVWTAEEFENSIIRARVGKRPLLAGDLTATLRPDDGSRELLMTSFAQLQLTDNSSWIRSRKFRLGVRVIPGSYPGVVRIQEAVSEPFVVRDHRGKSYEKHYPPKLEDEVWRLEKIGKEGNLSMKLASAGVITVQDFLKMSIVNPQPLRRMMGSEKKLEVSLKHARTCEIFKASGDSVILDPICNVLSANIDGQIMYTDTESASLFQRHTLTSW
ncbi:protein SAR DEFICIENT 1-like isoform X2 [Punica granatum]|uniref:Protein SAR DEFICIENT 1-like isoform X2 n=1 Tax=Punica granatum TaxID=22663 RepID=A0A6P8BMN4_PUNGR|nr:protein SAR DEFICIENT 1-like isoform X2 [Punica granatum]